MHAQQWAYSEIYHTMTVVLTCVIYIFYKNLQYTMIIVLILNKKACCRAMHAQEWAHSKNYPHNITIILPRVIFYFGKNYHTQ